MKNLTKNRPSIAVIGSGISGIVSAYWLSKKYDVHLFEYQPKLGGHTNTVTVTDSRGLPVPMDTGFIVFNEPNYPEFRKFMAILGQDYIDSDMSFGYYSHKKKFWYSSDFPAGIFSQKKHLISPVYWRFIAEILRFNRIAKSDLESGFCIGKSLNDYLKVRSFMPEFIEWYLLPMGAAIWSCPTEEMRQFPVDSFFQFWKNHDLFNPGHRPVWKTLANRGQSYLDAFQAQFEGKIHLEEPVLSVERSDKRVIVTTTTDSYTCDHVVLATHADISLRLLKDPTPDEINHLSPWRYSKNIATLHSDTRMMPPDQKAWASWLVHDTQDPATPLAVTYNLNRLQALPTPDIFLLTLNDPHGIDPKLIHQTITYDHPVFTQAAMDTQSKIIHSNGQNNTYFCGAYQGFGFHEDGVKSGLRVAQKLGIQCP